MQTKYKRKENKNLVEPIIKHRKGAQCPVVEQKCNLPNNIYKATIKTDEHNFNYIGMSAPVLSLG